MTTEEKAKAYDEALEQAKMYRDNAKAVEEYAAVARYENIFPQLRESEDEKMRKFLLNHFKFRLSHSDIFINNTMWEGIKVSDIINYLEKQKVESHDGKKWIYEDDYHKDMERCFNDGKDEVLENPGKYGLQKEHKPTPDWMPRFLDELRSKKNYFDWDEHRELEGHILAIINWIAPDYFNRKEQEQKPAECIEFANEFENQVSRLLASVLNGEYEYNEGFVKHVAQSLLGYAKKEQKPAWSEEDERMLSRCIKSIECSKMFAEAKTFKDAKDNEINWLKNRFKSLRPQPKQEWSEDDEKMLEQVVDVVYDYCPDPVAKYKLKDWLNLRFKSLRPSWKPSEEQMEALARATNRCVSIKDANTLLGLLNQIKNL